MKQKVGPVAIVVAVIAVLAFLFFMFRTYNPPQPRNDTDNPKGMPAYAQNFLKQRKAGAQPAGATTAYPGGAGPTTASGK